MHSTAYSQFGKGFNNIENYLSNLKEHVTCIFIIHYNTSLQYSKHLLF